MSDKVSAQYPATGGKTRSQITTGRVIVLVIAAAAPLAAMVGNTPLALVSDAALSLPVAFVLVGLTLLAFAAGYTALSKEIRSLGAFYTQVGQGLGRTAGVVAAHSAAFAYAVFAVGMAAAFGYFAALVAQELGADISWMVFAAVGMGLVACWAIGLWTCRPRCWFSSCWRNLPFCWCLTSAFWPPRDCPLCRWGCGALGR